MRIRYALVSTLAAGTLAVTGCGGDKETSSTATDGAAATTAAATAGVASIDELVKAVGTDMKAEPSLPAVSGDAPTELVIKDVVKGTGKKLKSGAIFKAHYKGAVWGVSNPFDSSWQRGAATTFPLDNVVPGWQKGMLGMRVGGRRVLVIPSEMGYGPVSPKADIPANSDLVFVIDLKKTR